MITNGKYVSCRAIIEKAYRDMGMLDQLDFGNAVEWIGEAIEFIGTPMQYIEKVETICISHRKGRLPIDMHLLITAGAAPHQDIEHAQHFAQMRYSTDAYHMFCSHTKDMNCTSDITYKVNDDYMFVNFDEGTVRLAYKAIPVDEEGYPRIPDDIKFKNAVAYHLMMKIGFIKWMQGKINNNVYQKLEQDRDWYIGAAQTRGNMPNPDMMESIKNNWIRLIKKINQQKDGFSSAGHQEERYTHNTINANFPGNNRNTPSPTFFSYKDSATGDDVTGEEDTNTTNNC